jgi:3-oxoacyl-[acyl-carrier protein] reductase
VLDNKERKGGTALITGAGQGIGRAVALRFAREGINVVVNDVNEEGARSVAEEVRTFGVESLWVKADISKKDQVVNMADIISRKFDCVDILVNTAGILNSAMLLNVTEEEFDHTLSIHLKGTLFCIQAVAPIMIGKKYGRIINVASIGILGGIGGASYISAKSGIVGLTRVAALEFAKHNVTVNCVAPGLIDTEMISKGPKKILDMYVGRTPMQRVGKPEEVANCINFFASKEASFITGQTVFICGGLSIGF